MKTYEHWTLAAVVGALALGGGALAQARTPAIPLKPATAAAVRQYQQHHYRARHHRLASTAVPGATIAAAPIGDAKKKDKDQKLADHPKKKERQKLADAKKKKEGQKLADTKKKDDRHKLADHSKKKKDESKVASKPWHKQNDPTGRNKQLA